MKNHCVSKIIPIFGKGAAFTVDDLVIFLRRSLFYWFRCIESLIDVRTR